MKLPLFDPKLIPSRNLAELVELPRLPDAFFNRVGIERALSLQLNQLPDSLLRRDALAIDEELRPAAVLVLLVENGISFDIVLSVRASHLRHHAGQVSFVGGQMDEGETAEQAALREAFEEIGLQAEDVEIIGELPAYETITRFLVKPVIACISADAWQNQALSIAIEEVDHVFTVPLSFILNPNNIRVHDYEWQGMVRQYYSVTFGEYFIWGASMAMLRNLDALIRVANQSV